MSARPLTQRLSEARAQEIVRLRAVLTRIKLVAESQYARRAPAGSELLDTIAAMAEDALKGERG